MKLTEEESIGDGDGASMLRSFWYNFGDKLGTGLEDDGATAIWLTLDGGCCGGKWVGGGEWHGGGSRGGNGSDDRAGEGGDAGGAE
ncbi:hypothetical protein F0562_025625 [Nyssa sinensis]|uniref:Uncharacterized protein n=1 Tax=Nyssa sinensis TaxID=561372 RepID=A0A5J5B6S7_9ASTE|nr:hypothetical protein F0562_025625 [Nyssa sinensis]